MLPRLVPNDDWLNIPEKSMRKFWKFVDKSGGPDACWNWTGRSLVAGYGVWQRRLGLSRRLVSYRVHRLTLFIETGILGEAAMHMCDNKLCCNPIHLRWGTQSENRADCVSKGRHAMGIRHGTVTHPERIARGNRNGSRVHPERLARGESHGRSKLCVSDVIAMRRMRDDGALFKDIANRFGVQLCTAARICNREEWKHIP